MKFYSSVKKQLARVNTAVLSLSVLVSTFVSTSARAALPDTPAPSQGNGSGWLDTVRGYFYDGAMLVSVVVVGATIFVVGRNIVSTYGEIKEKKETWTQLAIHGIVGTVIIAIEVWLASLALTTLESTS